MKKELEIIDPKEDYEGCIDCKYRDIPDVACKTMGCVHAFHHLMDWYTKDPEEEDDE